MVLQQIAEARSPSVKKFRELLVTVLNDKHQPILAKSGAILAAGILDAGGGNVVISMQSRAGFMKMGGAVGIMMFLQHWYWYPLQPFLSLAFTPTMLIGLNKDFNIPTQFEVTCHAPPAMFAYRKIEEKKEVRCQIPLYFIFFRGVFYSAVTNLTTFFFCGRCYRMPRN
jgi:26S proteasome regulatory subunit N2